MLAAAKRARALAMGADPLVEIDNDKPTVIALREIAEGVYDPSAVSPDSETTEEGLDEDGQAV